MRTQSPALAKNAGTASPEGSGTKAVESKKTLSATNGTPGGTFGTPTSQATTDELGTDAPNDCGSTFFALVQADEATRTEAATTQATLMHRRYRLPDDGANYL